MKSTPSETVSSRLEQLAREAYVASHTSAEPAILQEITRVAEGNLLHPRMVSGHLQGRLLKMVVRMVQPHHVLELGTYSAYATIALAEGLPEGGKLTTIELNDELEPLIRELIERSGYGHKIELVMGDALEVLQHFPLNEVQLVYLDADKLRYPQYYTLLAEGLPSGAFIIADNVLWGGKVYHPQAHDAHTEAIRTFNTMVANDERVEQLILPYRDGLTLIHKL